MDDNDFLNAFMNVDILKAEGVATVVGRITGKLYQGMIEGGMEQWAAQTLISHVVGTVIRELNNIFAENAGSQ
jgi:hypothetical protein